MRSNFSLKNSFSLTTYPLTSFSFLCLYTANGLSSLNSGLWVGKAKNMRRIARRFYQATKHYIPVIKHPQSMESVQATMTAAMRVGDEISTHIDGGLTNDSIDSDEAKKLISALSSFKSDSKDEFDDFSQVITHTWCR